MVYDEKNDWNEQFWSYSANKMIVLGSEVSRRKISKNESEV